MVSVWSDNFTTLREDSVGPHIEKGFQVVMENLREGNKNIRFHTILSYSKVRDYCERSIRNLKRITK